MTQVFSQTFRLPYGDLHQWQNDIQTVQQPKKIQLTRKHTKICAKSTAWGAAALRLQWGVVLYFGRGRGFVCFLVSFFFRLLYSLYVILPLMKVAHMAVETFG